MDIREKMRRDWDRRAHIDARYWVAATPEATTESYEASGEHDAEALLAGLRGRVGPEARVLDLGCGAGRLTGRVAGSFAHVDGVDVSPGMIEAARAHHGGLANVTFHVGSGTDLGAFADATFDLVFSYAMLPHVPVDVTQAYFPEVNRVLKPGGWFRYQFWIGPEQARGENDTISIRVYSPEAFQRLNREAGFSVGEIEEIDYEDPILGIKPVWVNAQKVGAAAARPEPTARPEAEDAEGRSLEYGLLLYLAVKHGERGEADEAERVLEEAVATDPARAEAYVQWAGSRLERDDVRGARTLLQAGTEHVPACAPIWLYRAQLAVAEGDLPDANRALKALSALRDVEPEVKRQAAALRRKLDKPRRR